MSRINNRNNVFIESVVTNAVPTINVAESLYKFSITFRVLAQENWYVVYKNSTQVKNAFKINQKINASKLSFYDAGNSSNKVLGNAQLTITNADYSDYDTNKIILITADLKIASPAFIPVDSSNNITFVFGNPPEGTLSNIVVFPKIGADSLKSNSNSGSLSKSLKKSIRDENSLMGTLPSTKITTGKVLQSFNDPFDDTNIIEFSERDNVYASIGLPLKDVNQVTNKFYLSTTLTENGNLVNDSNLFNINDKSFRDIFNLDNTKIFSPPNKIENLIKYTRVVDKENLPHVIKQERFQEEYTPFREESFYYETDHDSSFYKDTIDSEANKNYSLGEQKQIKITLDFKNSFDLHLMNTQMSFVIPDMSLDRNDFLDNANNKNKIVDLRYFNYTYSEEGGGLPSNGGVNSNHNESFSCHSMPTAYWNNAQQRWNYLDASDENYLGAKIRTTLDSVLPNNFIFEDVNGELKLKTADINLKNYREFKNYFYNRPILTTPSYRHQGLMKEKFYKNYYTLLNTWTTPGVSFLEDLRYLDIDYVNKSAISQITDTYGFPHQAKWQPNDDHLIDMSSYLSKDFLLEKVIFKGKFTHKGEFPTRFHQVSNGFELFNAKISEAAIAAGWGNYTGDYQHQFGAGRKYEQYDGQTPTVPPTVSYEVPELHKLDPNIYMPYSYQKIFKYKDFDRDYAANTVTFFLLNEKKSKNYLNKKNIDNDMQHFTFLFSDDDKINNGEENISYLLKNKYNLSLNKNGNFNDSLFFRDSRLVGRDVDTLTEESTSKYSEKIKIKTYSTESNKIYSVDEFNLLNNNPESNIHAEFNKSRFHYIDDSSSENGSNFVENLYYKKYDDVYAQDEDNLLQSSNIFGKIKTESVNDFDETTSRELVSFSNLLITRRTNRVYNVFDTSNTNYSTVNVQPSNDDFYDEEVLKTIDYHCHLDQGGDSWTPPNLNVLSPKEFVIKSFCKNVDNSNTSYLDESDYTIGSNFFVTATENAIPNTAHVNNVPTKASIKYSIIPGGLKAAIWQTPSYSSTNTVNITSNNHGFQTGDYVYFAEDLQNSYLYSSNTNSPFNEKIYQVTVTSINHFSITLPVIVSQNYNPSNLPNIKHSVNKLNTVNVNNELDNIFEVDQSTGNVVSLLGYTLPSGPLAVPQSITKLFINSKENVGTEGTFPLERKIVPFIQISFSYTNNSSLYSDDYFISSQPSNKLNLSDFITYTDVTSDFDSNYTVTNIDINLRFLNTFKDYSIIEEFINFGKSQTINDETSYKFPETTSDLPGSLTLVPRTNAWSSYTLEQQSTAFSLLLCYAIISCDVLNNGYRNPYFGNLSSHPYYSILPSFMQSQRISSELFFKPITTISENNRFFSIKKENHWFDSSQKVASFRISIDSVKGFIELFNGGGDPDSGSSFRHGRSSYRDIDGTGFLFGELNKNITSNTLISFRNVTPSTDYGEFRGEKVIQYFNKFVIPEGKTNGENGINIESNRIINKKRISEKPVKKVKSHSGKFYHEDEFYNSTIFANYLLKPEDKLVFGITSNCNGQKMPTVFRLHDKLEITLIGRDYVDNNNEYKNNESKSIRKVVLGDNYIEKHKSTVEETNNSYFDNVWNKDSLENSLKDFKEGKIITNKNSLKQNGSYFGMVSFENEKSIQGNSKLSVFKKDTVNPSLGNVYSNCLQLTPVSSRDINFNKSLKILISENFESISNSINVINKWHRTYHLETFNTFFNQSSNLSFNDTTLANITNDENFNIEVCYDTNGYIPVPDSDVFRNMLKNNESKSQVENITNANVFDAYSKSIKKFCLPVPYFKNYQNGLQIKNEEKLFVYDDNSKKYLKHVLSDVNINKKLDQNNKVLVENKKSSIQFFDVNNINNGSVLNYNITGEAANAANIYNNKVKNGELSRNNIIEYTNFINEEMFANNVFQPQWNIVIEMDANDFSKLLNVPELNSDLTSYVGNIYHVFLYENNSDTNPVEKYAKVIKVSNTNDFFTIVIPLYFWETGEIDSSYINLSSNTPFSRQVQKNHLYNENSNGYRNHWYAKLSDGSNIIDTRHAYYLFVNSNQRSLLNTDYVSNNKAYPVVAALENSSGPGTNNLHDYNFNRLPYSIYYLNNMSNLNPAHPGFIDMVNDASSLLTDVTDQSTNKLVLDRNYYISLVSYKTKSNSLSPVYENSDLNIEKLRNHYKTKLNKRFLTHEKYFENNQSEIELRRSNDLSSLDENESIKLNEKIYRSKIYKKVENEFKPTNYYFVYKIHQMKVNHDESVGTEDNPINRYNIIEIIATDCDYSIFELGKFSQDQVLLGLNNNDIIRIYENSLYENKKIIGEDNDIPYFEIDLSTKTASFTQASSGITQILYSHTSIDNSVFNIANNINDMTSVIDIDNYSDAYLDTSKVIKTGNLGATIFNINPREEIEEEYKYKKYLNQEEAIFNFFYGFSKSSQNRFPIDKIDGFKYGVENGSKKTLKYYFSNRSYGQFADKLNSCTNCALARQNVSGDITLTYAVTKSFVDQNFKKISSSNSEYTYNKDQHERSTYPFIENSSEPLSQFYVEPN